MAEIGVALMWIAISAASARGLSALARAAVASDIELDLAPWTGDGSILHEGLYNFDTYPRALRDRS